MHAHNELVVLNRLLQFSLTNVAEGELYDAAFSVQVWTLLQVLAAKLVETWKMLHERFLTALPEDPALGRLSLDQKQSLAWLIDYFGGEPLKNNALRTIRDKTAFHYDKLNLDQAIDNLAGNENAVYLAQHPANTLYYLGSALVFRSVFATIAKNSHGETGGDYGEQSHVGFDIAQKAITDANLHIHSVLYGLIENLMNTVIGVPLVTLEQIRTQINGAPKAEMVGLPPFIDIGGP
jgi:hypothetical protein